MGKSKKKKKSVKRASEITDDSIPRSFVFHRGEAGKLLMQLVTDLRHVMEPYTATNLKVNKNNVMKDFVNIAGPYGISHFIIFSKTETAPYMKICRLPRGPTLTFRMEEYSLMRDVVSILKKPKTIGSQYKFPPLVVLNNFNSDASEMKLMTTVFQNMFPSIKVQKVKLGEIRRCTMFNYDKESGCIDFRHYNIEAVPIGVSRGVKKLLKNKVPNLGSLNDISDFMTGSAYLSESEGEDPIESQVTLPQRIHGRGNIKSGQSAVRLTEMGPRLKLTLIKIEEGVGDGEVLYHKYVQKTAKEMKALKKKKEEARRLKEKRKREQDDNIARKEKKKEEHKAKSLAGMKRKMDENDEEGGADGNDNDDDDDDDDDEEEDDNGENKEIDDDDDDDIEYYKQEVGDEPDEDLLQKRPKKMKFSKYQENFKHRSKDKRSPKFTGKKSSKAQVSKSFGSKVKRHSSNNAKFKKKR